MSRTYRRKNYNEVYYYFGDEEEFNQAYQASLIDFSEWLKAKPKLPNGFSWEWIAARKIYSEYSLKYDDWYDDSLASLLSLSERYKKYAKGCVTYEQYVRVAKAISKTENTCGSGWLSSAPSWYCNQYFERPMRRAVKSKLKHAYKYDTFDDTVYPEWINGAAWSYW